MANKGDISLNYIIIAIIALIVLVVAVLFFSGAAQTMIDQLRGVGSGVPQEIKAAWESQCKLLCIQCNEQIYSNQQFEYEGKITKCADLTVGGYEAACTSCPKPEQTSVIDKIFPTSSTD